MKKLKEFSKLQIQNIFENMLTVTAADDDDDDVVVWRNQKSASVNALLKYFRNVMMLTQVTWRSFIGLGQLFFPLSAAAAPPPHPCMSTEACFEFEGEISLKSCS